MVGYPIIPLCSCYACYTESPAKKSRVALGTGAGLLDRELSRHSRKILDVRASARVIL